MPFIQKNVPPPNNILSFNLLDFSGGLNNRSHQLRDNESPDMCNFLFSDETLLRKRNGVNQTTDFSRPETGASYDGRMMHIGTHNVEGKTISINRRQIDYGNGHIKIGNITPFYSVFGENIDDYYFVSCPGFIGFFGRFPTQSNTYVRIVGTSTFEIISMELVNPPSNYTPLGTNHTQGVHVFDYTNKKCWYEPCENEMADPYKGANVIPSSYYATTGVYHEDRVFLTSNYNGEEDSTVYVSDLGNPFYFPVYLGLSPQRNGDMNVALCVFQNEVILARQHEIYVISGNTNRDDTYSDMFRMKKLNTHTGFMSANGHAVVHNYLFYLGKDCQFYALTTTQSVNDAISTQVISSQLDLLSHPINAKNLSPDGGALKSSLLTASAVFFKDEFWVGLGEDKVLVYSYRRRAWTLLSGIPSAFISMSVDKDKLYFCSETLPVGDFDKNFGGFTYTFTDDYLDNTGAPYKCYWKSKNFAMGFESTYKQFREFYLVTHVDDYLPTTVKVRFEVDYADVGSVIVSKSQMSRWGISTWGSRYITRNISASLPFVIGRRGRYIRFILENGYDVIGNIPYADLSTIQKPVPLETVYYVYNTPDSQNGLYVFGDDFEWHKLLPEDLNQPFKFYEINGDYEFRGKR